MKIDTDALVDQRSATIQYLDSDTMDEERLSEAMAYINAKYEALPAAMYARLCGRVAWHVRKIGRFHQTNADRLERVNRDFPDPKLPGLVRWKQCEAQQYFEIADKWAQAASNSAARSRRQRFRVVPTQLRLPGLDEEAASR